MAAQNVNVCDIGNDVKEAVLKFRFSKQNSNTALILKVNREKQVLEVEENLEVQSLDELQDILPGHQPRYIVYSFKLDYPDGRIGYPICFIFYTPRDAHMELQVMYAGTQRAVAASVGANKILEVRELEELTQEWLEDKLMK